MLWKVKECYEIILGRHNQGRTERGGKQGKVFRHPLPPPSPPHKKKMFSGMLTINLFIYQYSQKIQDLVPSRIRCMYQIALNIPPTNKTIEVAFCGE